MSRFIFFTLLLLGLFNSFLVCGQENTNNETKKDRNGRFLVLPIISSSPETSLRLGAIGIYFFRGKNAKPGTQLSTIKVPFNYTLNNQIKFRFSYEFFLSDNQHIFDGHAEWQRFPLLFYGIGSETQDSDEETYTTEQITFTIDYLTKIKPTLYLGFRYFGIDSDITEVEEGNGENPPGLLAIPGLIPGNQGGFTSGAGPIIRYDKRDNIVSATTGPYVQSSLVTYQNWLGSDFDFTKFTLDARHFIELFDKRHVIAFQAIFERNWGDPSFENMALLGGDEIMRGHFLGRFRDKVMIASQVEYRLPLGRRSWIDDRKKMSFWERWGMAVFAGLGNVSPEFSDFSFDDLKSSLGVGLRFLALPKERANIRVDFGFGSQTPAFYLDIREAF